MDCKVFREKINDYMDGECDCTEEMKAHISVCPDCAALASELFETKKLVSELPDFSMPDSVVEGLSARIKEDRLRRRRRAVSSVAGIAAALVVLIGGYSLFGGNNPDKKDTPMPEATMFAAEYNNSASDKLEACSAPENGTPKEWEAPGKVMFVPKELIAELGSKMDVTEGNIERIKEAFEDFGIETEIFVGDCLELIEREND